MVDPRICTTNRDEPTFPSDADLVQPETEEERAAFAAFMLYVSDVLDWGRVMDERIDFTREEICN